MLTTDEIQRLPDYLHEIDRIKLRFNGIGPRLHEKPGRLWPAHYLVPQDECRKILHPELRSLIVSEEKIQIIENVIIQVFEGLRGCNTTNLFNKFCPIDVGYFDQVPFTIINAMEAYTHYPNIHDFIYQAIRSINRKRPRGRGGGGDLVLKLFGSNKNFDTYKQHVKWLVNGNLKLRKLVIGHFVHFNDQFSMDLSKVTWLHGLEPVVQYRVFIQTIYAITRFITELLRRYFYITVSNPYANRLFYYRYDLWQKLQTKVIKHYENIDLLFKFRMDSSINIPVYNTSKLKFYLKRDNVRMICTKQKGNNFKKSEIMLTQLRAVLIYILNKMPNFTKFSLVSLMRGLKEFRQKSRLDGKEIYFVRADVENCFQSIRQDTLRDIILESLEQHLGPQPLLKLVKLSCTLREIRQRKTREISRWILESQLQRVQKEYEHVRVINQLVLNIEKFKNDYLCPQIMNPVLRESKTSKNAYNLLQGIRQGSLFSPLLCSIYIQHAFNQHMSHLINSDDCRLFRYVDDILFMTTDLDKAHRFMEKMMNGLRDYALHSNPSKLACNFDCEQLRSDNANVQRLKDYVLFYKRKISLVDLHCTYHYSYNDISIDNTFHVSPYFNHETIYNSIVYLSRIELIHLDFDLNGVHQVIENIYESALLTAHRTACLLVTSFVYKRLDNQQPALLIKLTNRIARRIMRCIDSGLRRNLVANNLSFRQVRLLILAAYLSTWKTAKLRHRTVELSKLERRLKRYMMDYLVSSGDDGHDQAELRGVSFERKISDLIKKFPTSDFAREVLLPTI